MGHWRRGVAEAIRPSRLMGRRAQSLSLYLLMHAHFLCVLLIWFNVVRADAPKRPPVTTCMSLTSAEAVYMSKGMTRFPLCPNRNTTAGRARVPFLEKKIRHHP